MAAAVRVRTLAVLVALLSAIVPVLTTAAAPAAAAAATSSTKNAWSIGLYRGSLHLDYLQAHETWLGRPIETVLEMIPTDGWNRIDDPSTQIRHWPSRYDVLFTTPMIPKDGTSTLAAGADGAYDDHWRSFATTMIDGGRANARIRLGHEFNHTHYPWNATGGKEATFAAYYRRIVTVMRSVPGAEFRFTWNVLSGVKTADVERAYPGDEYVDVVSLDLYDGAGWIDDFQERWRKYHTQPYGLDWLVRFATAHGKPMAFDEWALIKSNDARRDPNLDSGDDTVFINGMIDFFESHDVVYANYFDVNTKYGYTNSRIMDGPYPNATAAYLARVRATPGASGAAPRPTTPTTTPVPPTTVVPAPTPTAPPTASTGSVVLLAGSASPVPNGDGPLRDRLAARGLTVTVVDDDTVTPASVAGASMVVISSSVVPTKVPAWLATLALPVLTAEVHAQRTLQLGGAGRERAATSTVRISNPTHPLAGGVTGDVAVQASTAPLAIGTPVSSASVVATADGGAAVFGIEAGAPLATGVAPARRVGFFFSYDSPPALTSSGWALFDAAVAWLRPATPPGATTTRVAPGAAVAGNQVATVRDGSLVVLDGGAPFGATITGGAVSPSGAGAWSVTADGRVFRTGDARDLGSRAGAPVNAPIVGITPTPTGLGYWLLGRDGGIYSYGDARFFGSTGAMTLNQPVVGMAATTTGRGYWLFAADGGIFTFGDARFFGSTGALRLNAPITTMAPTPTGRGYWLLGADGGVFTFGDARFAGSTGGDPSVGSIEAIVPTSFGGGYWLIGRDARLHAFGDAR